jgi:hypothetical protein
VASAQSHLQLSRGVFSISDGWRILGFVFDLSIRSTLEAELGVLRMKKMQSSTGPRSAGVSPSGFLVAGGPQKNAKQVSPQ